MVHIHGLSELAGAKDLESFIFRLKFWTLDDLLPGAWAYEVRPRKKRLSIGVKLSRTISLAEAM
eukprot:10881-Eustigmatos_ZCMA.PRE.1